MSELNPDFWWNHQLLPPPPRVGRCWSFFGVACKAAVDGEEKISVLKTPGVNRNPSEIMARKHKICSNQLYTYMNLVKDSVQRSCFDISPWAKGGFFYFDVSPKSNTFKNHDEKNTPCHSCIESYLRTMVPKGSKVLHKGWFFGVLVYHPTYPIPKKNLIPHSKQMNKTSV